MRVGQLCFPYISMISLAIVVVPCIIMIVNYDRTDWDRKIWIGSKILTLEKLINKNNNYLYPILSIDLEGNITRYKEKYEWLLKHSGENCTKYYKKCGILDTLGNIMCIPKDEQCPINDIFIDSISKKDEYINEGYQVGFIKNLSTNSCIYYTNNQTENNIITKIEISETVPKYINESNLIFDEDSFDEYYTPPKDDDDKFDNDDDFWDDWDDYHSYKVKSQSKKKLTFKISEKEYKFGDQYTDPYIRERFNDEINIDKTYTKISDNLYVGNYLGFKDYESMKNFSDLKLYDIYFTVFPNNIAYIFCYICGIAYVLAILIYIWLLYTGVMNPEERIYPWILAFFPYLAVFLGFFTYTLYERSVIYRDKMPFDLIDIKADPFLEDLLREIKGRHCEESILVLVVILFSSSVGVLIFAFFVFCCCRQMTSTDIENNTKNNKLIDLNNNYN